MEKLQIELLEATLTDIKQLVIENPNDGELGKKVRSYFNNLPILINDFKINLKEKDGK